MQTKNGIRLTEEAKRNLQAWHADEPETLFRIQASPYCGTAGGASWTLTPVYHAWDADTVITIEGVPLVYSTFLEYLMEDVEVDWVEDADYEGPVFHVNQSNPAICP